MKQDASEKLELQDFDLFAAISAIDKKDYDYYDRLTEVQQKKFVPFMLVQWISAIKGNANLARYYLMGTEQNANTHLFNENIKDHPKLVWLMLCASSPGIGKQFHQWVPQIKERVTKLKEPAKTKDIKEYFKKIYPKSNNTDEMTTEYVTKQHKAVYLASKFPNLKHDEIDLLSGLITDDEISNYEKESGN